MGEALLLALCHNERAVIGKREVSRELWAPAGVAGLAHKPPEGRPEFLSKQSAGDRLAGKVREKCSRILPLRALAHRAVHPG